MLVEFSRLELMKTPHWSTMSMSQDRLNCCALMSIANDILQEIDFTGIITEFASGPSIKYVMLFLANFDPPPPVTHPGTPQKYVTHLGPPGFLVGLVQKNPDKSPMYKFSLNCSRGFCPGGFVRGGFCPFPLLSEYICYNRKVNITLNFMFHMYDLKKL